MLRPRALEHGKRQTLRKTIAGEGAVRQLLAAGVILHHIVLAAEPQDLLRQLDEHVSFARLPDLAELCVQLVFIARDVRRDIPAQSTRFLARLLSKLSRHANQLRALRVDFKAASELPSDDEMARFVRNMPARLEYATWCVPFDDPTDYYRVLRPVQPTKQRLAASAESIKPRLERLLAMFRPFVDRKVGVWEDLSDLLARTLFDHMGDESELEYL
ncbi:hypothetical protein OC834_003743 [Tilletia horrida]|nr:hypothetical protein OC834_003743 [Tilletia horrida]